MEAISEWPAPAKVAAGLLVLACVVAIWCVLASTIFLAGTGLLHPDSVPFGEWWAYYHAYGFKHPQVGLWLKISAGVTTGIPLLIAIARVMRGGDLPSGKELHGSTRFATKAELKKAGFYADFQGLYVGQDDSGALLRFGGPEHVACYAPTGSGKGVGLVIPNCLLYEASLVCLDVKKENWAITAGIREAAGQKVFLFDPLAPDGCTARYNPFTYVRRGTIDAFEDIQRIAQMVFPHAGGDQQFWTDSARSAFTGAAGFLAETPELPLTFGEVLRLLSSADGAQAMLDRIEARRQQKKPYTEAVVKALEDYLKGSADLVNSIRKTVTARLSLWFNPRIDAATAESDFDLRELRRSLHAIYVGVTPDNVDRLRPLLALFFQQLIDLSVRELPSNDPQAKHQIFLLLDEFPLLGPMPVLANAFAYVRGYGMRMMLIMQSKAQLRDRDLYGPDKAAAILDNCGLEVVFGTKDQDLAEELSKRLGYDTVETASRSGPRFWATFRTDKLNTTLSQQRRALLLPQEVTRLKDTEALLIRPGMYPVKAKRLRYWKLPLFARLVRPAPVVPPIEVNVRLDQGKGFEPIASDTATATAPPSPPAPAPTEKAHEAVAEPAKPKRSRRKPASTETAAAATPASSGSGASPRLPMPPTSPELPLEGGAPLRPHQSEALLGAIMGAQIDLSDMGLADGKAAVSALIDVAPTVERLNRRGAAA
ncbi:type IV secretory system conjugative DNA transfer family protein [Methylobacterium radiotolerans]|uniref:type IV secretory system conjugative DNA transfer family protein n=1 Tax=Methylobacterium radiotolerans TaxID=31998 RepID=UPI000978774D|nr:type IV secretory system conjugative DNA transfer family protein [Methylobacterium radiotolerans]